MNWLTLTTEDGKDVVVNMDHVQYMQAMKTPSRGEDVAITRLCLAGENNVFVREPTSYILSCLIV